MVSGASPVKVKPLRKVPAVPREQSSTRKPSSDPYSALFRLAAVRSRIILLKVRNSGRCGLNGLPA